MADTIQARLIAFCDPRCKLNPARLGDKADAVIALFEAGGTNKAIFDKLSAIGVETSEPGVTRHRREHLRPAEGSEFDENARPPGTFELVDAILAAGWRNRKHWRPTLNDTLRAAQMKIDMGGGEWDPMLQALEEALDHADADVELDRDDATAKWEGYR